MNICPGDFAPMEICAAHVDEVTCDGDYAKRCFAIADGTLDLSSDNKAKQAKYASMRTGKRHLRSCYKENLTNEFLNDVACDMGTMEIADQPDAISDVPLELDCVATDAHGISRYEAPQSSPTVIALDSDDLCIGNVCSVADCSIVTDGTGVGGGGIRVGGGGTGAGRGGTGVGRGGIRVGGGGTVVGQVDRI